MSTLNYSVKLDPGVAGGIRKNIGELIRKIAFLIEGEAKISMTLPKHGREYNRKGRIHVASAPGEAPAVDTGNLINSIRTNVISETEAQITVGAEYAETLEFDRDRPFIRPAIDSVLKRYSSGGILASARE